MNALFFGEVSRLRPGKKANGAKIFSGRKTFKNYATISLGLGGMKTWTCQYIDEFTGMSSQIELFNDSINHEP